MTTRVIALHGSAGSGKSTLTRLIGEYLGTDCFVMQENLDELLTIPSSDDHQAPWYHRTTTIQASDSVTGFLMEYIGPLSVLVFTLTVHFLTGTIWPVILLFIGCLTISRLCRYINSVILSKMWLYNVFLLSDQQKRNSSKWIWRDRTCLDIYTYCLLNKATSVPSNMVSILLEQTYTTSVAIILDVPYAIIDKHLRRRIKAPTTSHSFAIATRLILWTQLPIRASIAALKFVEQWYGKMNVPVIKISQLRDKLDCDRATGEIQWNKHSMDVLLETVERAIEQRGSSPSTIDESLMPWQIVQNSRLFHI